MYWHASVGSCWVEPVALDEVAWDDVLWPGLAPAEEQRGEVLEVHTSTRWQAAGRELRDTGRGIHDTCQDVGVPTWLHASPSPSSLHVALGPAPRQGMDGVERMRRWCERTCSTLLNEQLAVREEDERCPHHAHGGTGKPAVEGAWEGHGGDSGGNGEVRGAGLCAKGVDGMRWNAGVARSRSGGGGPSSSCTVAGSSDDKLLGGGCGGSSGGVGVGAGVAGGTRLAGEGGVDGGEGAYHVTACGAYIILPEQRCFKGGQSQFHTLLSRYAPLQWDLVATKVAKVRTEGPVGLIRCGCVWVGDPISGGGRGRRPERCQPTDKARGPGLHAQRAGRRVQRRAPLTDVVGRKRRWHSISQLGKAVLKRSSRNLRQTDTS
ncbi:hypothetical protein DFH07DRAFT_775949 [Mycena maculata]|uniref:Uncharacterized protein n=1 Tax=Mycena maculata TaxID=230809 RepID=A0AAD7IPA4_9AGAR|nr:hypothetical protein DFH07DRAFT_775949 [Mycena maculata]